MNHPKFRIAVQTALCALTVSAVGIAAAQSNTATPVPTGTLAPTEEATAVLEATPTATEFVPTSVPRPMDPPTSGSSSDGLSLDDAAPISFGDEIEGALSSSNSGDAYTFEAEQGQAFTATLIAEDFDCYLVLYDEDGNEVAYNDDAAGNLDSRLTYAVPSNGTYTLLATSYSARNGTGTSSGDYTLSLDVVDIDLIEYSQTVEGELTTNALQALYSFSGQAGDTVVIRNVSDDFDSYLRLTDAGGYELISNDDGAGSLDAQIGPYTLPSSGTYQIIASSLNGTSEGQFTLSLDRIDVTEIAYGDSVEAELDNGAVYFQFTGDYDDVVSLSVDGDVDTSLTINDPGNYLLISDEDSGSGRNPEILDYVINQAGTFLVIVRAADAEAEGTVTLSLERGQLPTLDEGPITLSFSSAQTTRIATFTPVAGTTYRLTMRLLNSSTFSPSADITQDGSSLGYFSGSSTGRVSVDLTPYSDSPIRFTLSDYSYTNTSVEVSITEAE